MMTKNRANLISVNLTANNNNSFLYNMSNIDSTSEPDDVLVLIVVPQASKSASDFVGDVSVNLDDAMKVVKDSKTQIMACRIEGLYDDYVGMLVNKTKKRMTEGDSLGGRAMILDSYDGAEHRKTQSKKVSIVSFSSQLISKNSIRLGMSPASSHNILTWQQMIGSETSQNLFPVLEPIYERKKHMLETAPVCLNGCDVSFYDLHDGKMLYLFTAHSLHNRRHHPFLLCKCQRGQGCIDENHECVLIPHKKQSNH